MNNTFMANPDKVERKWYVVDATGYTLGRLSSEIAKVLRGQELYQPDTWRPHKGCPNAGRYAGEYRCDE